MASLFIVFMLVMSHQMPKYAVSIREFTPVEGAFFRLEGVLNQELETENNEQRLVVLCENDHCIQAVIPVMYAPRLKREDRLIVEGHWTQEMLHVSKVLTRCH